MGLTECSIGARIYMKRERERERERQGKNLEMTVLEKKQFIFNFARFSYIQ